MLECSMELAEGHMVCLCEAFGAATVLKNRAEVEGMWFNGKACKVEAEGEWLQTKVEARVRELFVGEYW